MCFYFTRDRNRDRDRDVPPFLTNPDIHAAYAADIYFSFFFSPLSPSLFLFLRLLPCNEAQHFVACCSSIARKNAKNKNDRKNIKKIENFIPAVHKKKNRGIYYFRLIFFLVPLFTRIKKLELCSAH